MNPTERYIKMCEKAKEIQKEWKPSVGDIVLWRARIEGELVCYIYDFSEYSEKEKLLHIISLFRGTYHVVDSNVLIWLPTQEQLQKMVHEGGHPGYLLDKFVWWVIDYEKYRYSGEISYPSLEDFVCRDFSSMNELWLAFVMWTKYHKVWDDEKEEWVKVKTVHNPVTGNDYPVREAKDSTEQKEGLWDYKNGGN